MNNENRKPKLWLKILGFIVLAAAIGCVITAAVDFFVSMSASMGGADRPPRLFWLFFVGFVLIVASSIMIQLGKGQKLGGTGGTITHTDIIINNAPINNAPAPAPAASPRVCPYCGKSNPPDAYECGGCGAGLQ